MGLVDGCAGGEGLIGALLDEDDVAGEHGEAVEFAVGFIEVLDDQEGAFGAGALDEVDLAVEAATGQGDDDRAALALSSHGDVEGELDGDVLLGGGVAGEWEVVEVGGADVGASEERAAEDHQGSDHPAKWMGDFH